MRPAQDFRAASSFYVHRGQTARRKNPRRYRNDAPTTGFLGARFVDLQRATFDIHAVEFSNRLRRFIFWAQFHESETFRFGLYPYR